MRRKRKRPIPGGTERFGRKVKRKLAEVPAFQQISQIE